MQNLHYTYDPAGNITHIRDDAQQTIYFRNKRVEPSADYTYDAIYRLIEATGREHLGQVGGAPIRRTRTMTQPRVGIRLAPANDGNAMGTYIERYVYDAVGNFLKMQHRGSDPAHPGWTRSYAYNEASLIEPAKQEQPPEQHHRSATTETYSTERRQLRRPRQHDAHAAPAGDAVGFPGPAADDPAPSGECQTRRRAAHGERTWYVYDAAGQRVRKVTELATLAHIEGRAHLPRRLRDLPRVRGAANASWSARRCTSWTTSSASP